MNPTPTDSAPPAIEVRDLRVSFDGRVVLDGIDLTVPAGGVLALLGPNGAGKTTTVRALTTLLRPDAGTLRVAGHDVRTEGAAVRRVIGVTGQFSAVDTLLTGRENLRIIARLHHLGARREGRVGELLRDFGLDDAADRPVTTYSGGMKRRLDLAMSLMARPDVLFLDEPTTGLDPASRRVLWGHVRALVSDGVTVLLTTQYLQEADELADRVAVLDDGRIVAEGTPAELKAGVGGGHATLSFADRDALEHTAAIFPAAARDDAALSLRVPTTGALDDLRSLIDALDRAGAEVTTFALHEPDLDDVFLAVTQHPTGARP